jgi:hypothetical protein
MAGKQRLYLPRSAPQVFYRYPEHFGALLHKHTDSRFVLMP